jgi:hypothetical protein
MQGNTEKSLELFTQSETVLNSLKATSDDSTTSPSIPEWFILWKAAILSGHSNRISTLPDPPGEFLSCVKIVENLSIDSVMSQIISLYNDDKLGEAVELLSEIRKKHQKLFYDHPSILELENDYREILDVLRMVKDQDGWHSECSGEVSVKYKSVEGTKTYSLLTEATLDVPMKNYITMVFEIDLYSNWVPFCKKSYIIEKIARSRRILGLEFNVRFVPSRHTCLYGFGANLLSSEGCVVICAKSCDQKPFFKGINLPKFDSPRAEVTALACILTPINNTRVNIKLLTNFDPNMYYVPYKILNFFSRKLAKGIFKKVAKLAVNFKGSEYEKRITCEENREFYEYIERSEKEYLTRIG